MKKILLLLSIISFSNLITAQVKVNQNAANSAINTSSAFMDASSSPLWNGTTNQGKGMLYPRVDLVNYTAMSHAGPFNASNNPNYFDGLLVFNTATGIAGIGADSVFPGYYYYRNTTTTANGGHWVSLKGIKGDDGSIGPIGPQGVQGIAGNDGAAGATGLPGATGSVGATGATGTSGSSSSGLRIGYASSANWTCPAGITQITVEIWSGGGGGGGGCGNCVNTGCYTSYGPVGRDGGNGGNGGYIKAILSVTPGAIYLITVGGGGAGGGTGGGLNYTSCNTGVNGGNGGASSFDGILSVAGGTGGMGANPIANSIAGSCTPAANGISSSVTNYSNPSSYSYSLPSYVPASYITAYPGSQSVGGAGGINGGYRYGPYTVSPTAGSAGEKGYCVISY